MMKAIHNAIGPFFFDVPDFDDCGGRTTRRVEVPKAVLRDIVAAYHAHLEAAGMAIVPVEANSAMHKAALAVAHHNCPMVTYSAMIAAAKDQTDG